MEGKLAFLDSIKDSLRPDTQVMEEIESFVSLINDRLAKHGIKARCTKGGSIAKGTFIRGDYDVDLFVRFDKSYDDISGKLEKVLEGLGADRVHGSRDYFKIERGGQSYELVPVLDIESVKDARNVTDASPFHVEWLKANLQKGGEDEIRLAKRFCKSAGVYGAESYIQGFSGHLIDILVVNYGSFMGLIEAASRWKPKVVLDPAGHFKRKSEILLDLNKSKTEGPIVVVDPVMPQRNAAASVGEERFSKFVKRAKEFIKDPSERFFEVKRPSVDEIREQERGNVILAMTFTPKKGKTDVAGSRIVKIMEYVNGMLVSHDLEPIRQAFSWDKKGKAIVWFVFKRGKLPEEKTIKGPPPGMKDHAATFRKKYKDVKERDGMLVATVKREVREPQDMRDIIGSSPYVKERSSDLAIEIFK